MGGSACKSAGSGIRLIIRCGTGTRGRAGGGREGDPEGLALVENQACRPDGDVHRDDFSGGKRRAGVVQPEHRLTLRGPVLIQFPPRGTDHSGGALVGTDALLDQALSVPAQLVDLHVDVQIVGPLRLDPQPKLGVAAVLRVLREGISKGEL